MGFCTKISSQAHVLSWTIVNSVCIVCTYNIVYVTFDEQYGRSDNNEKSTLLNQIFRRKG